jgi:hypothetical protein
MSSAARASSTSPEGASCSCSASRTPSPLDACRRRQIRVLGMYARRSPICGRSWRCSSPRTSRALHQGRFLDDFRAGDVLAHLPYGHRFHRACAQQWLEGSRGAPSAAPAAAATPTAAYRWSGASRVWERKRGGERLWREGRSDPSFPFSGRRCGGCWRVKSTPAPVKSECGTFSSPCCDLSATWLPATPPTPCMNVASIIYYIRFFTCHRN